MRRPRDSFRVLSNILMTCMCMIDVVTMYSSRHNPGSGEILASVDYPVKHGNNHDDGECHNAIIWICYYHPQTMQTDHLLILLPVTRRFGGKRNSTVVNEMYERAICIPVNTTCCDTTKHRHTTSVTHPTGPGNLHARSGRRFRPCTKFTAMGIAYDRSRTTTDEDTMALNALERLATVLFTGREEIPGRSQKDQPKYNHHSRSHHEPVQWQAQFRMDSCKIIRQRQATVPGFMSFFPLMDLRKLLETNLAKAKIIRLLVVMTLIVANARQTRGILNPI